MGVDHLGSPGLNQEIQQLWRELRRVAKATLQNASIGRAGIRVYDGGWIVIENGGLEVEGLARVIGELEGSGTLDWWGPWFLRGTGTIAGDQNVTGDTTYTGEVTINGAWKFVGPGEITGNVDLKGILNLLKDLLVKAGGRIVIEGADQIVLEQSGGVARMRMGASEIRGGDGLGLYPNNGPSIISTSAGLRITNLPTIPRASANNAVAGTLWQNAQGYVYRVVT